MRLRPRTNRLAIPRMYKVLSVGVPASVRYTIIFKFLALGVSASYAIVPAFMVILFFCFGSLAIRRNFCAFSITV